MKYNVIGYQENRNGTPLDNICTNSALDIDSKFDIIKYIIENLYEGIIQ